jgi:hypothetical protein
VDTFATTLTSAPVSDVTVTFISATNDIQFNPATVTFTPTGLTAWNIARTITVEAIDDSAAEGFATDHVDFSLSSADNDFNGLNGTHVIDVLVHDNDCSNGGNCTGSNITGGGAHRFFAHLMGMRRMEERKLAENPIPHVVCPYFIDFLRRGDRDFVAGKRDVAKLQGFLNERNFDSGQNDGVFGPVTEDAVKTWQASVADQVLNVWHNFMSPTGYFYKASRHVANKQVGCPAVTLLDNGTLLQ